MIPHIKILSSVIILMTGMFSLLYTFSAYKSFPYHYLKSFLYYIFIFNGFELLLSGLNYFQLNIFASATIDIAPVLKHTFALVLSACFVGMAITMVQTVSGLLNDILMPIVKKWVIPVAILGVAAVVFDILLFEADMELDLYQVILYTSAFVYFFEFPILIFIIVSARNQQDKQFQQVLIAFATLFLFRYVLLPGLSIFPEPVDLFRGRITFLYSNIIPFIWIKYYFLDYAKAKAKGKRYDIALAEIVHEFSISKRELEILKLILDGNSNKEIKAKLFISYHTVKNHVYNLFQKLGVKSRYELMHFLQERNS